LLHGIVLRDLDDLIASEQALRRAIQLEPENQLLYRELAATLQAGHRTSEAARALTEAAQLLLRKHDYREAERLSKQALNLDPSAGPSYLTLGRAQMEQKRYDDALEALEKAASLDHTAEVSLEITRALFFRKSFLKALESVDRALASSAELAEALGLKGVILHRLGKPDEALLLLDESLARNSKQAWFQAERGAVLESLKRPKEALAAYREAVELDPKNRWAYNRMGLILLDEKRYEDAASALEQALKFFPNDEAAFALEQSLQYSSDSMLHMKRGEALYHLGRDEEAISAFNEALHHDPSNADASSLRGSALLRLRHYQEAVAAFHLTIDWI
jgi:tetratricopeptide (TPR) repeat protein